MTLGRAALSASDVPSQHSPDQRPVSGCSYRTGQDVYKPSYREGLVQVGTTAVEVRQRMFRRGPSAPISAVS